MKVYYNATFFSSVFIGNIKIFTIVKINTVYFFKEKVYN